MFFFSHQTDRLNPFILTDFSCGTKKIGQDLLSRPFLIGNQNDVKYRSFDLLAAYAVVQPASAFGSSIKHRGMVLQTKNRAHNKCAPAGVFSFYRYNVFLTFKSVTLLLKSPEFLSGKTSVR